ncbi:MAG: hypothetical protein KDN22_21915 [Verrucomicrobiae bacterium]|nr:hypothetical protein [Verrucomicrobiae bacterium]
MMGSGTVVGIHFHEKHQWNSFFEKWEAQGERFSKPIGEPVPDDENAVKVPMMMELTYLWQQDPENFDSLPASQRGRSLSTLATLEVNLAARATTEIQRTRPATLTGAVWAIDQSPFAGHNDIDAAREILARFDTQIDFFEEVDAMLGRRELRLPEDSEDSNPPHVHALLSINRALRTRALAHIRCKNGDAALADIARCLKLADLIRSEPSHPWLSTSAYHAVLATIWEGLRDEVWDSDQLTSLQSKVNAIAPGPTLLRALREFRSMEIEAASNEEVRKEHNRSVKKWNERGRKYLGNLWNDHSGYPVYDRFRPQCLRWRESRKRLESWQNAVFAKENGEINNDELSLRIAEFSSQLREQDRNPQSVLDDAINWARRTFDVQWKLKHTTSNLPELNSGLCGFIDRAFELKVQLRLASTAIALERYQRTIGNYPQKLEALVPEMLSERPGDPWLEDSTLAYALRSGGRPAVWSVGENQRDESGYVNPRHESDDIVWQYERADADSFEYFE